MKVAVGAIGRTTITRKIHALEQKNRQDANPGEA
jgi:hypothetical protein